MAIQQDIPGTEPFRNKVAESGIMTLDLSGYVPGEGSLAEFDIKPLLFMEMILKEKDFRAALQSFDWSVYEGKHTGIMCSADAIVPVWAYMLVASYLQPFAASVHFAAQGTLRDMVITSLIAQIDPAEYVGQRVVLKGCGDVAVPEAAYVAASARLRPVVKSLMYGEPCSTVPIYKQAIRK